LKKKWETFDKYGRVVERKRDACKWLDRISCKWAALKMGKDEEATRNKGGLRIERRDVYDGMKGRNDGRSVDEMLTEVKPGDESKVAQPENKKA
jgi:hypothetical protein